MPTLQQQLDRFETRLEECRRSFMEDGRIDPSEQDQLDRLNARIRQLRESVGEEVPSPSSEGGSGESAERRGPAIAAPDGAIPRFGQRSYGPQTHEHAGFRLTIHAIFGGEQLLQLRQLTVSRGEGEVGYQLQQDGGQLNLGYGDNRVEARRSGGSAEASINVLTLLPGLGRYCEGEHFNAETTFSLTINWTEEEASLANVSFYFGGSVEAEAPGGLGSMTAEAGIGCETDYEGGMGDGETTCTAEYYVEITGPGDETLVEQSGEVSGRVLNLSDGGTGSLAAFWAFNQIQSERLGQSPDGRRLMLGPGVLEETSDGPVHRISPSQLNTRFEQYYTENLRLYNEIFERSTRATSIQLVDTDQSDPRSWTIVRQMQGILRNARGQGWPSVSQARAEQRRRAEEESEEE